MGEETTKVAGYGIIPKQVIKDTRLSIEAKAIYCYLSAYAGNDGYAFPSLELILNELQISEKRYYKHRDILIKLGYITTVEKKNKKGQYSRVIFKINPLMQNEGTDKKPFPHFSLWENDGYTNNNITNNNINNIYSPFIQNKETDTKPLIQNEEVEKKKTTKKDTIKIKYAEFVSMTEQQYNTLIKNYGEEKTNRMIEVLDNYKGAKGKTYKDDYRAILNWVVEKVEKEFEKKPIKDIQWEEVFNNVK